MSNEVVTPRYSVLLRARRTATPRTTPKRTRDTQRRDGKSVASNATGRRAVAAQTPLAGRKGAAEFVVFCARHAGGGAGRRRRLRGRGARMKPCYFTRATEARASAEAARASGYRVASRDPRGTRGLYGRIAVAALAPPRQHGLARELARVRAARLQLLRHAQPPFRPPPDAHGRAAVRARAPRAHPRAPAPAAPAQRALPPTPASSFPCTWPGCTYLAAQPKTLLVHRRRHTGERPYICTAPGCARTFGDPRILAAHVARGDHGAPLRVRPRAAGAAAAAAAAAAVRLRGGGAPAPGAPAFSAIATVGGALLCVAVARGPKREGKAAIRGWVIDAVTGDFSRRAA
jgi:hypothetical protein